MCYDGDEVKKSCQDKMPIGKVKKIIEPESRYIHLGICEADEIKQNDKKQMAKKRSTSGD